MWPKVNDKEAWRSFVAEFVPFLTSPLAAASLFKCLGHIIYEERAQRFGDKPKRSVRLKQNERRIKFIN